MGSPTRNTRPGAWSSSQSERHRKEGAVLRLRRRRRAGPRDGDALPGDARGRGPAGPLRKEVCKRSPPGSRNRPSAGAAAGVGSAVPSGALGASQEPQRSRSRTRNPRVSGHRVFGLGLPDRMATSGQVLGSEGAAGGAPGRPHPPRMEPSIHKRNAMCALLKSASDCDAEPEQPENRLHL